MRNCTFDINLKACIQMGFAILFHKVGVEILECQILILVREREVFSFYAYSLCFSVSVARY